MNNIPYSCNQQILMDLKDNILFKTFLGKFHSHYFEDNEDCIYLNPIDKSQVSNLLSIYEIDVRDKDISEHTFFQSYRLGYLFKVNASLLNSFLNQKQDEDKNEIKDVYLITYFGFELIQQLCNIHDVELICLNNNPNKSLEEELVSDLISLVVSFSGKLYGHRSHKNKQVIEGVKQLICN